MSDVTGQVKVKMFDISGLVTSASKIAMLSTNKAQLIGMDSVSYICKYHLPVLCDHNRGQGHLRSPGKKKVKQKISWFRAAIHVFRSDFAKNAKNDPKTLFEVKIGQKIKLGKSR